MSSKRPKNVTASVSSVSTMRRNVVGAVESVVAPAAKRTASNIIAARMLAKTDDKTATADARKRSKLQLKSGINADAPSSVRLKPSTISKPSTTTTATKATTAVVSRQQAKTISRQPIRAVHNKNSPPLSAAHNASNIIPAQNVMNRVHNVTVLSPPRTPIKSEPAPRSITEALQMANQQLDVVAEEQQPQPKAAHVRDRTRTHTLDPAEVMVLKGTPTAAAAASTSIEVAVHKDPVAFEITFDEKPTTRGGDDDVAGAAAEDENSYEDDFDSYESDFDSLSTDDATNKSTASSASASSAGDDDDNEDDDDPARESQDRADEDHEAGSEQRGAVGEDLDSGMFDWKSRPKPAEDDQAVALLSASDSGQMDSGFGPSTISPTPKPPASDSSTAVVQPTRDTTIPTRKANAPPPLRHSTRAQQLLDKITLDTMTYALLDLKPMPYAHYMRLYGHRNATQMATQTPHHGHAQDAQTVRPASASAWTQMPAEFFGQASAERRHELRTGCGRIEGTTVADELTSAHAIDDEPDDEAAAAMMMAMNAALEHSMQKLSALNAASQRNATRGWNDEAHGMRTTADLERMAMVLRQADATIAMLCNRGAARAEKGRVEWPFSVGCRALRGEGDLMKRMGLIVDGGDGNEEMLCGLHDGGPEEQSLATVWNLANGADGPEHILSSWTSIRCLAVDWRKAGVFYGGLADGYIALWNVNDAHGRVKAYQSPSQLIEPQLDQQHDNIGAVVALQLHPPRSASNRSHADLLFSLHEAGVLTAWTVLPTTAATTSSQSPAQFAQLAPGSRLKLIQTAVLDLRTAPAICGHPSRPPTTRFDRTRSLFESNLFCDTALQELHLMSAVAQQQQQQDGSTSVRLRGHDLLTTGATGGQLLVATNRAYLVQCSVSLHADTVQRIRFASGDGAAAGRVYATRLARVHRAGGGAVAVGLSDGAVRLLYAANDGDGNANELLRAGEEFAAKRTMSDYFEGTGTGKSCAIQSIIEEERAANSWTNTSRAPAEDITAKTTEFDDRQVTASDADDTDHSLVPLRLRNQLRLLHALDGQPVHWLRHARHTNVLYARLADGRMRAVDLVRLEEITDVAGAAWKRTRACALAVGVEDGIDVDKLLLLMDDRNGDDNGVEVHSLSRSAETA